MSGKASHPCLVCGRQLKRHRRAKATVCSRSCREELKRIGKKRRRGGDNR